MNSIRLVFVGALVCLLTQASRADSLGALYLVISNDGAFNLPEGQNQTPDFQFVGQHPLPEGFAYTVVHFMDFVGGTFPAGLLATVTPLTTEQLGVFINTQFFFIGTALDSEGNAHLLLGDQIGDPLFPRPIRSDFEQAMIRAILSFAAAFGVGAPGSMEFVSDGGFWSQFVNGEGAFSVEDFRGILNEGGNDLVPWTVYSSMDASGSGSENVFGFTDPALAGIGSVGGGATTGTWINQEQLATVPEPASLLLLAGAGALVTLRRRRAG